MISFKRDIYKLKAPPRPPKPTERVYWYVSDPSSKLQPCTSILNQVYKDPQTTTITAGVDRLYTDFSLTQPLVPLNGGVDDIYNISQEMLTMTVGSPITAVQVDNTGLVLNIFQDTCNPTLNLQTILITSPDSINTVCNKRLSYQVKVNADDIDPQTLKVKNLTQLYKFESTNSNPINLNPINDLPGYTQEEPAPRIGLTNQSASGTLPTYSMNIVSNNGIVYNSQDCT